MTTFTRPLTEIEKIIWQKKTNKIYEGFTTKAAKGRKMSVENILKIASGRVWSGMQAKQNGLVDVLGGFNDAVTIAAKKAGIDKDYKLRFYPKQKSFFAQWLQDMEGSARTKILEHELGENYQVIQQIKQVKNFAGVQARLPFEMQWK